MKNRSFSLTVLLAVILIPDLLSQSPIMKSHSLIRGREEYNVNVIYQAPGGLIWFGTDRGLFRFNGDEFSHYTLADSLPDLKITALCSGKNDTLWIGHDNGKISCFDGYKITKFNPEEGLGDITVTDIVSDSTGTIWYSTRGEGLFRFDGKYLTNLNTDDGLSDNSIHDIEIDENGIMWLATDNGISRYSNGKCEVITVKEGLSDEIVRVIKASGKGRLIIGTDQEGIDSFDTEKKIFSNYPGWKYGTITDLVLTLHDEVWVSTQRDGIIQLKYADKGEIVYRRILQTQGQSSERKIPIIKDSEENIWIGTRNNVIQFIPPLFEFLNRTSGAPFTECYSLALDRSGNLWVCTETGLIRGTRDDSGEFTWSDISEKLGVRGISFISLFPDETGLIWAGTYGEGVFRIDPVTLKYKVYTTDQGLGDNNIISISGSKDKVWFSTLGGGVSCFNLSNDVFETFQDPELKEAYIYATRSTPSGKTWIAGPLRYPSYLLEGTLHHIGTGGERVSQLYGVTVDPVNEDAWFNTGDRGLIRVYGDSIRRYADEEGIDIKKIRSLVFDRLNNLIIISDFGIMVYRPDSGVVIQFGEKSDLSYKYPELNAVYTDENGNIWIGTRTGIIKYNPEYLKYMPNRPKIFLTEKRLDDMPVRGAKRKFKYRDRNFTFGYTGIWFTNPEALRYRYMLKGFEDKWNYSNRSQARYYPKLPPGEYTFTAEVSLDDKNWFSTQESSFTFRIRPPFWRTWWFISILTASVLAAIYLYIKARIRKLEKDKAALENEVAKRTEEIRKQNNELARQKKEIEEQRDIAQDQRDMIEAQKDEIQASIRYAQKIQAATLPPKKLLEKTLRDYFILNKPKDIVSGDFYWVAQNSTHIFFAVGDCTGHGVPGAFMSMLGLSALNDIVKSLRSCKASTILDLLRKRIQESLHQVGELEMVTRDGMDISLCILEIGSNQVQFAGAHNPLYLIRNGEIIVMPADRIDISIMSIEKMDFTNQEFQCKPGDQLYLFSDGYADQFGGPNRKKYKYQKFKDFLVSIHKETMVRQKWLLDEEIEIWKGNNPQLDDILIMGIKIPEASEK